MGKIVSNILIVLLVLCSINPLSNAEDSSDEAEINVFAGMFDFSDDKQRSTLFGLQHQNEDLFRKSFLGKLSPITGGFLTENSAFYFYTGAQAEYNLGLFTITPSFAPGYYNSGDGKDLGSPLEFKSEISLSLDMFENSQIGYSYNHISNNGLGIGLGHSNTVYHNNLISNTVEAQSGSQFGIKTLDGNTVTPGNYWSDYVGYDADYDGKGDIPYESRKLFEQVLATHPNLRLFLFSPAVQSIDLAAKALPTIQPKPKLIDENPLMNVSVPPATSIVVDSSSRPITILPKSKNNLASSALPKRGWGVRAEGMV